VLHLKQLLELTVGDKVKVWGEKLLINFEVLFDGRPWEAGTMDRCPNYKNIIAYRYYLSSGY